MMFYNYYSNKNLESSAQHDMFWETNDTELKNTYYYKEIIDSVKELSDMGVLERTTGYCIATSDIISKLLRSKGIECSMVECSLLVIDKKNNNFNFVGYEDNSKEHMYNRISSHIICITKTEIPILIDLSVPYISQKKPFIIERIKKNSMSPSSISEYEFGDEVWSYSQKLNSQYPMLHQQNIVERIETDTKIENRIKANEKQIKLIQKIVLTVLCISSINMIRGFYDHYQKYVIKDNGFGPNKIEFKQ